jgi:hypothetical protein
VLEVTIDILRCQPNNHQIISGSYQHDNTLTVVLKKITCDINFTDNKSHQGAKFGTVGRSCFTERLKHIIKCSSLFVGTSTCIRYRL